MKLYIKDVENNTYQDKGERTAHYVYADGEIEPGFDIVCYSESDGFDYWNDRIEDVVAVWPDGTEIQARLFFWHSAPSDERARRVMENDPVYNCHGRLVAFSDAEAMAAATELYNKRSMYN